MTEPFTISISWAELALFAAVYFVAGAFVWKTCSACPIHRRPAKDSNDKDKPFEL